MRVSTTGALASAALAALLIALWPARAAAHQSSVTYARLDASADRLSVDYELRIATTDLFEALDLPEDRAATDAEIEGGTEQLLDYVQERVDLAAPGQECRVSPGGVRPVGDAPRFAELRLRLSCPEPIEEVVLDYDLFFDLDPLHTGLVTVDGDLVVQLRYPDDNRLVYTVGETGPGGALGFVRSGVEHIVFGYDHILFLLGLLFVVVLRREPGGDLGLRSGGEALRHTALIVTAFTVAHSLTLIAAALEWITLPGRLVESVIAASIVLVAVENLLRPDPPRRQLVTFVFGLVHGLGFASMLRPLLPPDAVVAPLLAFNVGVELGQLAIVAVAVPALAALARSLGAARYRRAVLPVGCGALIALGLGWLIERAFDVAMMPF